MCCSLRTARVADSTDGIAGASIAVTPTMTRPPGNGRVLGTALGQPGEVWELTMCFGASCERNEVDFASALSEVLRPACAHAQVRPRLCAHVVHRFGATRLDAPDGAVTCGCSRLLRGFGYAGEEIPRQAPGRSGVVAPRYACGIRGAALVVVFYGCRGQRVCSLYLRWRHRSRGKRPHISGCATNGKREATLVTRYGYRRGKAFGGCSAGGESPLGP